MSMELANCFCSDKWLQTRGELLSDNPEAWTRASATGATSSLSGNRMIIQGGAQALANSYPNVRKERSS